LTLLLLMVVSILLALGMALLPPVTGAGLGSVVTRSWLLLGALVFCGHYLYYLDEGRRAHLRRRTSKTKVRHRPAPARERSAEYR
jgi:hypothetical protein